ncbi:MAG: hypothetical protein OQK55_01610, partial [Thermoanaerobaculales bacterium]|nr:hypothetical protein [Thermoanaerobaculales bacterium]
YIWGWYPEYFWGGGGDGQRLIVAPPYDIVAVFTGGGYDHQDIERIYQEALHTYVFPAVLSAGAVPPNPAGRALLDDAISRAGSPRREPEPVGPLPAMAHQVSGRTYVMHVPYGYLHLTLSFPANDEARLRIESSPDWVDGSPFEFAAGLDDIARVARGRNGIPAAGTGEWLSEDTFMMDVDQLGNLDTTRLTFEFEDNSVTLTQEDTYWFEPGPPIVLTGSAQD